MAHTRFGELWRGCGSFQALFPSRGSCRCEQSRHSRLLTARMCPWSCRAAQLCHSQAGMGTQGTCDCHSHTGSQAESSHNAAHSHFFLLTFCAAKKSSNSTLRCDYRVPKNFSVLALLPIYLARAASALVGFLV